MNADELLKFGPFELGPEEKNSIFLESMKDSALFHYNNCERYREFCKKKDIDFTTDFALKDIPVLPVDVFKKVELLSVPKENISKLLHSSSTTGTPSSIPLDNITARRQMKALTSIMTDFIGQARKTFIVLDQFATIKEQNSELSSRGTAIRSMMPFASKMYYILDDELNPDMDALEQAVSSLDPDKGEVCIFGFTYLIYNFIQNNKTNDRLKSILSKLKKPIILHIGGWKKLTDLNVDKQQFSELLADYFSTEKRNILDFYGMTEQLGTVYLDCEYGFKHVPVYSDIIVRDVNTLEPVEAGKEGFMQLLSPIPNSYPGISVLSDDIGVVLQEDGCKCGRRGKTILFKRRAEQAEVKGCGDTLRFE